MTLVGMPGSGKSTLAKRLAAELGLECVDSDAEIEAADGRTIPVIFAADGEECFRRLESAALARIRGRRDAVVASGGGAVTREENLPALRDDAVVVWVRRPLAELATAGRPLSAVHALEDLYAARAPLYAKLADLVIDLPSR